MKAEKERWNRVAEEYMKKIEDSTSQGFLIRDKCLNPYLFDALGDVAGKKILDLGCGDAWLLKILKQKGAIVEGCDISEKFIEIAQKKNPDIPFEVIDFITKHEKGQFDIVVCNIVLHITKFYKEALEEMYRVLKPGGIIIATIMHPEHYKANIADFSKREERLEVKVEGSVHVIYYRRVPSIYEDAFVEKGFEIVRKEECLAKEVIAEKLKKYSEKPFFLMYVLRKK